jgi:ERCC4-type nuclease
MVLIKIDTREQELFKKCETTQSSVPNFNNLKFIVEPLPLGDIVIYDDVNAKDLIIIERKSLSDLAASIKDGRYEEQSYRLNGLPLHNHNIVYLIEGDLTKFNTFKERMDKLTLYSAMISINYFKGFSIMRTNSMEETAMLVCAMAYKLNKDKSRTGFYSENIIANDGETTNTNTTATATANESMQSKEYCSVVKKVKKENITSENIGEIMLCQIPGISSSSAIAVLAQFKTLPNLIKCIQENPECLNGICTQDANGKSRKISKSIIATLVKYFNPQPLALENVE